MTGRTSSAEPVSLSSYAADGAGMATVLAEKADALLVAADNATTAGLSIPGLSELVEAYRALAADWHHLDEFAGDVAAGFAAAAGGGTGIVTVGDTRLAELGQVGFADRREAIDAADEAAQRLAELRSWEANRGVASREALAGFIAMVARGQHDPAFSVAFSEALGVDGYISAVGLVPPPGALLMDEGREAFALDAMAVLGTTLTTALDTRRNPRSSSYLDQSNAGLTVDRRLDRSFIDALADGEVQDLNHGIGTPAGQRTLERRLSVLMSFTRPPAAVAVAVANGRLRPWLTDDDRYPEDVNAWSEHGGVVTNYATMLGRDPDAAAIWLTDAPEAGEPNLGLVLGRDTGDGQDGGRALAAVVEAALTEPDLLGTDPDHTPGAPTARLPIREVVMERVIDVIGGDLGEIENPHLHGALAAGAEANIGVLERMINDGWEPELGDGAPRDARNTHAFLRELVKDQDAADRVTFAYQQHAVETISNAPPPDLDAIEAGVEYERQTTLRRLGAMEATIIQAENNALRGSIEERIARQRHRAGLVDSGVNAVVYAGGFLPMAGTAIDTVGTAADLAGLGIGEFIFPANLDERGEAEQVALANGQDAVVNFAVLTIIAENPDVLGEDATDMSPAERRAFIRDAIAEGTYNPTDHDSLTSGYAYADNLFANER